MTIPCLINLASNTATAGNSSQSGKSQASGSQQQQVAPGGANYQTSRNTTNLAGTWMTDKDKERTTQMEADQIAREIEEIERAGKDGKA